MSSYCVRVTGHDLDVSVQIIDKRDLEIVAALMQKIGRIVCPTPVTGITHAFAEHEGESALTTVPTPGALTCEHGNMVGGCVACALQPEDAVK